MATKLSREDSGAVVAAKTGEMFLHGGRETNPVDFSMALVPNVPILAEVISKSTGFPRGERIEKDQEKESKNS